MMLDEWHLQGPDADGNVWLHIGDTSHNLGTLDQALEKFGNFLAENDYEEREPNVLTGGLDGAR